MMDYVLVFTVGFFFGVLATVIFAMLVTAGAADDMTERMFAAEQQRQAAE